MMGSVWWSLLSRFSDPRCVYIALWLKKQNPPFSPEGWMTRSSIIDHPFDHPPIFDPPTIHLSSIIDHRSSTDHRSTDHPSIFDHRSSIIDHRSSTALLSGAGLAVCPSIDLCVHLYVSFSIYIYFYNIHLFLSLSLSIHFSPSLSVYLSLSLYISIYLSVWTDRYRSSVVSIAAAGTKWKQIGASLSVFIWAWLLLCLLVCLQPGRSDQTAHAGSVCPSVCRICMSACLNVCRSVYLSICIDLSVSLSICLSLSVSISDLQIIDHPPITALIQHIS